MPSDSQDPEHYSIDEMMDRLKKRSHVQGEPELVTRPDGTQVVRVRKRKRRSRQPHKEQEKRRIRARTVQIVGFVGMVMLVSLCLLGMLAYHNSSGFLDRLSGKIEETTGAQVELVQFRVNPVGAAAQSATVVWPDHPELRELRLNQLSADLRMTSFLGGRWTGEEVLAKTGTLRLESAADAGGVGERLSGAFGFHRYRCQELGILFGGGARPPLQLRGVEASLYPTAGGSQLRVSGGSLLAAGWPELKLERGLIEFLPGEVNISSLRFKEQVAVPATADAKVPDGDSVLVPSVESSMECKGSFDPRSKKPVFLDVVCSAFPSEGLVGKAFTRLFTTVLDGEGSLSFLPGSFASHELVLPFEASASADGVYLGGLPFLDMLKTELQEARFAVPQFQSEAEGVLQRKGAAVELRELRLVQRSFLAIQGNLIAAADGRLSGSLEVGVAGRLLSGEGTRFTRNAFPQVRDGFCWTVVNVSGTLQSPQDDFAATLKKAYQTAPGEAVETSGEGGAEPVARDPGKEFEELIGGESRPAEPERPAPPEGDR